MLLPRFFILKFVDLIRRKVYKDIYLKEKRRKTNVRLQKFCRID